METTMKKATKRARAPKLSIVHDTPGAIEPESNIPEPIIGTDGPIIPADAARELSGTPKEKVWRVGFFTNPATGKAGMVLVSKDGGVQPHDRARVDGERVDEWAEVRAPSRSAAMDRINGGECVRFRRGRTGKVTQATPPKN